MRHLLTIGSEHPYFKVFEIRQGLPLRQIIPDISMMGVYNAGSVNVYSAASWPPARDAVLFVNPNTYQYLWRLWQYGDTLYDFKTSPISFGTGIKNAAVSDALVAVCGNDPYLYIYDRATLMPNLVATTGLGECQSVAFNHDGSRLAVAHNGGTRLRVYDTSDWSFVDAPTAILPQSDKKIAYTGDGSYIAAASYAQPYFVVLDAGTLAEVWRNQNNYFQYCSNAGVMRPHPFKSKSVIFSKSERFENDARLVEFNCDTQTTTIAVTGAAFNDASFTSTSWVAIGYAFSHVTRELYVIAGSDVAGNQSDSAVVRIGVFDAESYTFKRFEHIASEASSVRPFLNRMFQSLAIVEKDVHQITGTVRDINNAPCARLVRAFRRSDGVCEAQTMSSATTGDYRLILPDAGPYDVQFQAAAGELLNDLIFARSEPEPITV